jgi:lysophospholipase L1-like esterase
MNQSLSDKPEIVIVGDSWGCGEWNFPNKNPRILHPGIEWHFSNSGFKVKNLSKGGSSNSESIDRLCEYLKTDGTNKLIFLIKTDTLRDLRPYTNLTDIINASDGIFNLIDTLSIQLYNHLEELSKEFNTKIFIIGGLSTLSMKDFSIDNSVIPIVPSWIKLLLNYINISDHDSYIDTYHGISEWSIGNINISKLKHEIREKVIDELYEITTWQDIYKEYIFHPDGVHPNQEGHKVLFDYIMKELKL